MKALHSSAALRALRASAVKVFGFPLANNKHPFALRYRRAATNRRRASIPQPERGVAVRLRSNPNSFTAAKVFGIPLLAALHASQKSRFAKDL